MKSFFARMCKLLARLADMVNKHWIWKSIILFLPSVFLPVIVKYAGIQLGLASAVGDLTLLGGILTAVIYITAFLINVLSSYKSKYDKKKLKEFDNSMAIYEKVLTTVGKVCDAKLETIYDYIEESKEKNLYRKPFNEAVDPDKQLRNIAREIEECLSELTCPPVNNINVSMACECPCDRKGKMRWIDSSELSDGLSLKQLRTNPKTSFYKVYHGEGFLMYNDKAEAEKDGCYVFDKRDKRSQKIGSIVCEEIALVDHDGNKFARIILTISTYGYRFTDNTDPAVLERVTQHIKETILQQFEKRIRIEMALMYVQIKYNKYAEEHADNI